MLVAVRGIDHSQPSPPHHVEDLGMKSKFSFLLPPISLGMARVLIRAGVRCARYRGQAPRRNNIGISCLIFSTISCWGAPSRVARCDSAWPSVTSPSVFLGWSCSQYGLIFKKRSLVHFFLTKLFRVSGSSLEDA